MQDQSILNIMDEEKINSKGRMAQEENIVSILIAEDHPVMRDGYKIVLEDYDHLVVDGEAETGHEVLDMIRNNDFDLVLLDVSLPGWRRLEVLERMILREKPGIKVIILSDHPQAQYAVRAFKTGASGYMVKKDVPEELFEAINTIMAGGLYLSRALSLKFPELMGPIMNNG